MENQLKFKSATFTVKYNNKQSIILNWKVHCVVCHPDRLLAAPLYASRQLS